MKWGQLVVDVLVTFVVTLVVSAFVTMVWNAVFADGLRIEWETSLRLAFIIGIAVPLSKVWGREVGA